MDSRRVLLALALVALLAASASAFTCEKYTGEQAGSRCNPPQSCCKNGLWCDQGRCSARGVGDDVKIKACLKKEPQVGNRCDINNLLCCADGLKCNVGRCSK